MGVPKFFRYISERYPCLSEFVREYQIPVFDNLYLDMNGIIHMCSHPDDNNPHFRITEEKIFKDIFHYIEVLFNMIKPQKVFFLAVDGVAPRAKMNQQRGRRFRSAKDAEKMEKEAVRKGEKLPENARFDSNCITPGTAFMARLHEQLKYFIVNKISTDSLWKSCKVILSGHETPGEGEHKIMDYIRYIRSKPGYDPNTRHCLYGLDADLIMLGLCTHEPHFSLLREEVKFGKKAKRSNVPEEIRFYLLHLSLMREYLEIEFSSLKKKLEKSECLKFDLEKIIDDWILMGFLVGNDFIPHLPNLHIANGALPILYKAYIEVLPTLDGYINEAGTLNLKRFEKFMNNLADIDIKNFEEIKDDLLYFETKTGRKMNPHGSRKADDCKNENFVSTTKNSALAELIKQTDELDVSSSDEDEDFNYEEEQFKAFKDEYYMTKLGFQKITPEIMRNQAEGYVRAIQWNLNYYYNGVCSWSWYYPHHYSPYISDIKAFSDLKIEFDLGQPFKPYEQLLAVLPIASKNLLPESYHKLMTDENSIIKEFYPEDFQTDLNGKRQEWEAVVLVPFIDEKMLLQAMETCNDKVTAEEKERNKHGPMLIYEYTSEELGVYKAPDYFQNVLSHAECTSLMYHDLRVPEELLIKGAYPGAIFDVYYPGFPTLKHLKFDFQYMKGKVKVFETASRDENVILKIKPSETYFGDNIPYDLLDDIVWVGWPHLIEAKVVAISNAKEKYIFSEKESSGYKIEKSVNFDSALEGVSKEYRDRMGIVFGKTEVLVHVQLMSGRKYVFTPQGKVKLEKQFCSFTSSFPLQSIVLDLKVYSETYMGYKDINDVFPVETLCFSLTQPNYGSQGIIMESKEPSKGNQLSVKLQICKIPDLASAYKVNEKLKKSYLTLYQAACQVAISNYVFSRITGSLYFDTSNCDGLSKSVNIGLDLKFNKKNQETPGYTKKMDNTWFYTNKAVDIVKSYIEKFPEVFLYLSQNNEDNIDVTKIYDESCDEKIKDILNWLKTLPTQNIERQICGSSVLEPEVVQEIEKILDNLDESPKDLIMQIKPNLLFKPNLQFGHLAPDPATITIIFDRIVNVREDITVPLGWKGIVIAIHKLANSTSSEDAMYDIIFDKSFPGALQTHCSTPRVYRLSKCSFINLSHGIREMQQKTGVPGALRALAREKQTGYNFQQGGKPMMNNSAFASFNKMPQTPSTAFPPRNQMTQNKPRVIKNTNQNCFMPNFVRGPSKILNKENNESVNKQTQPPRLSQPQADSKSQINTDFLKQILNIKDTPANSKTTPEPKRNEASSSGVSRPPNNFFPPSASARLLHFYQTHLLGCPRYMYLQEGNGIYAQFTLPNGQTISGKVARSREEASEFVAFEALKILQQQPGPVFPPRFPEPPSSWRQGMGHGNHFVNMPNRGNQSYRGSEKRSPDRRMNRSYGPRGSHNTNFVPLQALKKQNKPPNNSNKPMNESYSGPEQSTSNKGNQYFQRTMKNESQNNNSMRTERPRKTRIAANFKQ